MSLFLPRSHGLTGHLRTTSRCGSVAISFPRPLDLPFECCLVAQPFIFVAHLWRLHPHFLATGTTASGPNARPVSSSELAISSKIRTLHGRTMGELDPVLSSAPGSSTHMTVQSCMSVSLWLVRPTRCNRHSCMRGFLLYFMYHCFFLFPFCVLLYLTVTLMMKPKHGDHGTMVFLLLYFMDMNDG